MADISIKYDTFPWRTTTFNFQNLGSSSTLVFGREMTAVDNTHFLNNWVDTVVAGRVVVGTSPVAGIVQVWVCSEFLDANIYPDVMDGADDQETITSADIKRMSMFLAKVIRTEAVTNRFYPFMFSLLRVCGFVPRKWTLFLTHNTGVNLQNNSANQTVKWLGIENQAA